MKKAPLMNQRNGQDWLELLEEDDFLMGKTPSEFKDSWEDEE